jgi:hypothetical protein
MHRADRSTLEPRDIHVVIGKVTVQAILPPQPISPPAPSAPRLSLEQYLKQREGRA